MPTGVSGRVPIPRTCPQCGAAGTIALQHVVKGKSIVLSWGCEQCELEWPVDLGEPRFIERRSGRPDRRRLTRQDRRKSSKK